MPPSISPRKASGNTRVATAAITRKSTANPIRPEYGFKKGTRPDSDRGDPLAGGEFGRIEVREGRGVAVEVTMRAILALKLGIANTALTIVA